MASIEFIQKRITGKEKEIDKLEKKLSRIRKAEATGWEINPYYYDESDLRRTLRELEEAQKALDGYREDLNKAQEKANSRNVPAILDFLERWKARVTKFYGDGLKKYYDEKRAVPHRSGTFSEDEPFHFSSFPRHAALPRHNIPSAGSRRNFPRNLPVGC